MMLSTMLATLNVHLKNAWHWIRTQAPGLTATAAIAFIVCLYSGIGLQRQADPNARIAALGSSDLPMMQINDWVAEYFSCANNQCKRVLKRMPNGKYEVATENLPLGRGRYVDDKSFSTRPTHVRLSHRMTEAEAQQFAKNWPREKPVIALSGQPVCDQSNCKREDLALPVGKPGPTDKNLIQFDSNVGADGHFGPQTFPPVIISQGQSQSVLSLKNQSRRGLFFEFGMSILAPVFVLALTFWVGMPMLFSAAVQFLAARAAWTLAASDTLINQPTFFINLMKTRESYTLTSFVAGWMFAALANFFCCVWMGRKLEQKKFNIAWAGAAIVAMIGTWLWPSGTPAAATFLRATDTFVLLTGATALGLTAVSLKFPTWQNRLSDLLRFHSQTEQDARWKNQVWALTFSFAIAGVVSAWVAWNASRQTFAFNWGAFVVPMAITFVLMYSKPQLTTADLQLQKDFVVQQELLVKLLSQLGTFRHRAQAISLVVNFCNRELPKLGFEAPTYSESQPVPMDETTASEYEVKIEAAIKGPHQCFGWLSARARKRSEQTAMGERIIDALTTTLAQHLDTSMRSGLLESEASSAQKFIPRDLMRLFNISSQANLESHQETTLTGTVVSVVIRQAGKSREGENLSDRAIIKEFSELFSKGVGEMNGYVVNQEGLRWSIVFRDHNEMALGWIENVQNALRSWNQHRQTRGLATHECGFGVHSTPITLCYTEQAGQVRFWLSFDLNGIASTLADVATDYSASTLLSQDYINAIGITSTTGNLPEGVRPIDRVWNRTKTETVDVFEFFGGDPDLRRAAKQRSVELFSQGVRLYLTGYFDSAKSIMSQVLDADPNDKAAQRLLANLSQSDELRAA
ncbi:MAG: hypothetical protein ACO3A4_07320 [Silvanigrellaceae bacterium]